MYLEVLTKYVIEDIAFIIEDYIGPYCAFCGKTFIDDFKVRAVHEGEYEYFECINVKECTRVEEKTKENPWRETRGIF